MNKRNMNSNRRNTTSCLHHLEHLDEGHGEVEIDSVPEVQGKRHEEAHGHDLQHVEAHGHRALDLHHMQDLQTNITITTTPQDSKPLLAIYMHNHVTAWLLRMMHEHAGCDGAGSLHTKHL